VGLPGALGGPLRGGVPYRPAKTSVTRGVEIVSDVGSAVAWAIYGVTFSYRSPLGGGVRLGGDVVVESPQGPLLDRVPSQES